MNAEEYQRISVPVRKKRIACTGASQLANLDVKAFLDTQIDEYFAGYVWRVKFTVLIEAGELACL